MVSEFKSAFIVSSEISTAFALRRARLVERRREARYPTQDAAEVEVRHGEILRMPAMVVDVSRSGLRLELPAAVKHKGKLSSDRCIQLRNIPVRTAGTRQIRNRHCVRL